MDRSGNRYGNAAAERPKPPGDNSLLARALLPAALLTVFFAGFHSLTDPDVWFHLRAGQEIARTGAIPRVDTFSYPSAGSPYLDLHWLFQLLLFWIYRIAGEPGLIWAACLSATGAFFILYRLSRRVAPLPLAAALTALGAILASERITPRPEMLTFLFFAVVLWLVRRHAEGERRAWFLIPGIFLVWVNTEGLFVIGYAAIAAQLLDTPRDRRLWAALGLSMLASLVNPYFLEGALHPFVLITRVDRSLPIYSATIGEFQSPFKGDALHPSVALFPYYLGLLAFALLVSGRWPRRGEMLLLLPFVYLAVSARRNIALLALAATPILARWLYRGTRHRWVQAWWRRLAASHRRWVGRTSAALVLLVLFGYSLALVTDRLFARIETNQRFGTRPAPVDFAREAARFLRENHPAGPVFSTFGVGSYFVWAYPEERVFIDGRLEVHSAAHYERYLRMLSGGQAWEAAEREFGFNTAVLYYMDTLPLTVDRLRDPSWATVHLDDTAIVLVKRNDRNKELIDREGLNPARLYELFPAMTAAAVDSGFIVPPAPRQWFLEHLFTREPFPWRRMNLGQLFLTIGRPDLALAQFLGAAREAPHTPAPRLLMASSLREMGRPTPALAVLESARGMEMTRPMERRMASVRGDVLLLAGRALEALAAYSSALEITTLPHERGELLSKRALATLRTGQVEAAVTDGLEGVRLNPGSAEGFRALGLIAEARGQPQVALQAYQKYQSLGGRSPEVQEAMTRLGGK